MKSLLLIISYFIMNKSSENTVILKNTTTNKRCDCVTESDCPYNVKSECNLNKENCYLENHNKIDNYNHNKTKIVLYGILGLLFYFIFYILSITPQCRFPYSMLIYSALISISLAIFVGVVIAFIVDIPARLKEYEDSFIEALSSNRYIKKLDENRLTQLRKDLTNQLHKKDVPFMAKGLIDIDEDICDLLKKPYYSRYRHSIVCSEVDTNPDYIKKDHAVEYKLINPYGANKTAKTFISFSTLIMMDNKVDEDQYIKSLNLRVFCSKDNDEEIEITDKIKFIVSDLDKEIEFYNKKIIVKAKEPEIDSKVDGFRVDFNDNLKVRMYYTIIINKNDVCFTERLRYPCKNFRLDYSHKDPNVKLHGQIFGTGIKQSDISIRYADKNNISLETFDWLLPENGVIVVS